MLSSVSRFMTSVFGSRNQRLLKRYGSFVAAANALESSLTGLSDDALRAKTYCFAVLVLFEFFQI